MRLLFSQTVLLFVAAMSFAVVAEDYDLYRQSSQPCAGSWNQNGTIYSCSRAINMKKGDTISYSGPLDAVTLKVDSDIQFDGNNTVGSINKSVSLESVYGDIKFGGELNQVFGGINAQADIILNNIEVSAPITTAYGLIKVSGSSNPNGVNTILGDIKSTGNIELENISLTGLIDTKGYLKISGSNNTVSGPVQIGGYAELQNIQFANLLNVGGYLKITGADNKIDGNVLVSDYISIQSTDSRVTGSIAAGNWIQLSNINVQGNVTSNTGYVTVSGSNNIIGGSIEANSDVTLSNIDVAGYVTSQTGKVTLTGEDNNIAGNVLANTDINLSNVIVNGDVESATTKIEIVGSGNIVNGNITTNTDIKISNIEVNGNIHTDSTIVEITGSGNKVIGNISANKEIKLNNTQVCGVVDSTYSTVVIKGTDNGVYADQYAIIAAQNIDIENTDVCGLVSSQWGQLNGKNSTIYCSLNGNCEDGATSCPSTVSCEGGTDPGEPVDYAVFVEPATLLALTCETVPVRVEVHKDQSLDENYSGNVRLTFNDGTAQNAKANSGVAVFNVDSSKVAELTMTASITVDDIQYVSDNQSVKFVPERYRVTPSIINMVAGTAADFKLTPMECSANGTPVVSSEFIGEQNLNLNAITYSKPAVPIVRQKAQLLDRGGRYVTTPDSGSVNLLLDFGSSGTEASASSKVKYDEVGKIAMTVSSTVCSAKEQTDLGSVAQDCRTYDGLVVVQARPWTMAICDSENAIADGTSNTSPTTLANGRYRAAGQEFDLQVKPIKWRDGLNELQQTHSTFCSDTTLVAENYFAKDAWSDTVTISHSIATPIGGQPGLLGGNTSVDKIDGVVSSYNYLNFANLTISEVGSFTLTARSTGSHYKDIVGGIDVGARTLGRFYPAYFSLQSFEWNEPSAQGYVNYMGQPFSKVTATAYAHSALGNKVGNYHLSGFDNNRLQFPALSDSLGYASRIENWYSDDAWQAENDGENITSVWSPEIVGVVFVRQLADSDGFVRKTIADGPFNTEDAKNTTLLALDIAPGQLGDPVTYQWGSEEYSKVLSNQPKVRYGRMALADVVGNVGDSISVPLKVEYFDGLGFVTNIDDDASQFNVDKYCLLSGVTTSAKFNLSSGQAQVIAGENNALRVMRPGTNTSVERVRLFLRQGDVSTPDPSDVACSGNQFTQPWLQFNWRNKGDEDPSTLVTFGAYRGNDRIIFRGEPGLTGQ